ncbi:hypothetical protein SEA_DONNY_86 [Mycobacterium phage Donny]|uniref:Uncharacterized protein n=3 Tax=Acadianvirus acadian TaxID=1982901 RepID=A0A7M1CNX5_9CAUD|nr:hypothetical protein CM14_gp86 [Mycobacterium phage Acadian]AER48999.1 hypothetical protein ACADIAN_86 [Mycobacterium phage Acadian]QBI96444.1 hypothetical protein SEA_DONNY_86 [Mycobacterium phage Donny]QOP65628.1 hypothetical protein SEA_SUIGENERIS_87 [Mycobacterium phage Suigeneris]WUT94856.1 hypothetical protein PRODRIGUEZ_86 [Mycobacterium phage PRodriguez]
MQCLGSGSPPLLSRRRWADRERYVTETLCPICLTPRSVRKDGRVRVHAAPARPPRPSIVGQLDEHLQREPRPSRRIVTQK